MEFLKRDTKIDFLGKRRLATIISAIIIVASIGSIAIKGLNFGIDFTGGTLVEVSYQQTVEVSSVRGQLQDAGFSDAQVQYFGTAKDILIRIPVRSVQNSVSISSDVMETLRSPFSEKIVEDSRRAVQRCISSNEIQDCKVQMRRVEFVGPQVGDELTEHGGLAMS